MRRLLDSCRRKCCNHSTTATPSIGTASTSRYFYLRHAFAFNSVGKRAIFAAKKPKTPVQVGVDCGRCERLGEPLGHFLTKVPNNGSCRSHICSPRRRRGKFEATPNPRRCLQGIPRFGV